MGGVGNTIEQHPGQEIGPTNDFECHAPHFLFPQENPTFIEHFLETEAERLIASSTQKMSLQNSMISEEHRSGTYELDILSDGTLSGMSFVHDAFAPTAFAELIELAKEAQQPSVIDTTYRSAFEWLTHPSSGASNGKVNIYRTALDSYHVYTCDSSGRMLLSARP